jgi:hypothetical protein
VYPIALFREVMTWMYSIHANVSPDVEIVCVSLTDELIGERALLVSALALTNDREEAELALAPFQSSPVLDRAFFAQSAAESSLAEQKRSQEAANPPHARYVVDNAWVEGEPAALIAAIEPLFRDMPTRSAFTIWFSMAPQRPLPDMAFSLQTDAYVATYLLDDDESRDTVNREWLNSAMRNVEPFTAGQYLGDSDMGNRQLRFMGDEQFRRLQEVIASRDPEGRFLRYLAHDPAAVNRNHWEEDRHRVQG